VLGHLFGDSRLEMKERHMGLVPAAEKKIDPQWLRALRSQIDRQTDWKTLLRCSGRSIPEQKNAAVWKSQKQLRIGMARDAAFSFYYEDNLDLLREMGAELVPFSPLADRRLPERVDGLYLGGGFPEVYAGKLERNGGMRRQISDALEKGLPAYAECGGLMYLGKSLKTEDSRPFRMTGFLPYRTAMTRRISMGYVEARAARNNPLSDKGQEFRGQIFHFSELLPDRPLKYAYRLSDGKRQISDGVLRGRTLASYLHVHFWTQPRLAERFLKNCSVGGRNSI
jgi:cobyrinic acid a,c-diamide synthase